MKNKTIITIAGRTAAGKSIIAKKLAERLGLTVLKSYTTRAPRPDEIANPADADHIFVSEAEYDKLTDIIAETCINGNRYCTTKEILKDSDCYVIDPDGLSYLKKNLEPGFRLAQFYVYADEDIRKKRFMERGKSESEFRVRSDAENEQFSTYEDEHGYDIIIFNNGNIEDAVDIMESYVKLIIKDRLDEIEAKKNGTWVEPESDDEEASSDEEAGNQKEGVCDDSVNLRSPSPDVEGVSDSTYTSSNLITDEQPEIGRGLTSIDDSTTEAETADSTDELPDEKAEENASSDEDTSLVSLADSILDIDAEESPEAEDEAAAEPKDSDFDPFSLDEDDSAAFGLEDEAEKPTEKTAENVNAEPEEDDSLTINETSEELTEEAEQQNTDDCEEADEDEGEDDEDDEDEGAEAILID